MNKHQIWLISGRDVKAYQKGGASKVKTRPWKAAEFDTREEVDAFYQGVSAAIGGGLRSVFYLTPEEGKAIDERIVSELRKQYPEINIKNQ
jgi:hypothetical protein